MFIGDFSHRNYHIYMAFSNATFDDWRVFLYFLQAVMYSQASGPVITGVNEPPDISEIPSGEHTKSNGKSPCLMGKSTISMAMFNSYFDITRGYQIWHLMILISRSRSLVAIRGYPNYSRCCASLGWSRNASGNSLSSRKRMGLLGRSWCWPWMKII